MRVSIVPTVRFSQQRVENDDQQRQQDEIEKYAFGYHSRPPRERLFLTDEGAKPVPTSGRFVKLRLVAKCK